MDDVTAPPEPGQEPTAADVARCLEVLRAIERLPGDHPTRRAVEDAASHVHRESKKRRRRQREVASRQADRTLMDALASARSEVSGVRSLSASTEPDAQELHRTRHCYGCKGRYTRSARPLTLMEGALVPERLTAFFQERADGNLEDPRPSNSWVLRLDEVPPVELLEVHCVNAMAPFLLNSRLKPLLLRSPWPDRYIVNVSAAEGQFQREGKTVFHPHTNMAKAALNMMTRTSAADYARDGIHMNSVDTGWFTNENPQEKRERMEAGGFSPPLDCVDAAARLYDPIVRGLRGQPVHGLFIRDYRSAPW